MQDREFDQLQFALAAFDKGDIEVTQLCRLWREGARNLSSLPPRYQQVLADMLDRLESSALFTEESCSFSVRDLRDGLQAWLDKARALQA